MIEITILSNLGILGTAPAIACVPEDPSNVDIYFSTDPSPLLQMISGAQKSLAIEIYTMGDKDVRAAIRTALAKGIQVRIVKDPTPLGETCFLFSATTAKDSEDCKDQQALVREVQATADHGGAYVPFNKSVLCANPAQKCFEHGKMAIVDGATLLVSTGNFDSTNLCDIQYNPSHCNRDYNLVTHDSQMIDTLSAVFENDLKGERYDLAGLLAQAGSPAVTVSPFSLEPLVNFIHSAKTRIRVQEQYLHEPTINAALQNAAQQNIQVQVDVASPCSFGKPSDKEAAAFSKIYQAFDAAGVASRMFTARQKVGGKPGYLHAKAIVVDEERAWVGSVNGSTTSVSNNREFGIFFNDPLSVRRLIGQMEADFTSPDSESWQEGLQCAELKGVLENAPFCHCEERSDEAIPLQSIDLSGSPRRPSGSSR